MTNAPDLGTATREQLLAIIAQQQRVLTEQRAVITQLQALVKALQKELAEVKRRQHRQAAPFSTGERVRQPQRPGRHPGEGTFAYRQAPEPAAVTGPPVAVPVTIGSCPRCGGELDTPTVEPAWVTDLPETPRPQVTEYRVVPPNVVRPAGGSAMPSSVPGMTLWGYWRRETPTFWTIEKRWSAADGPWRRSPSTWRR